MPEKNTNALARSPLHLLHRVTQCAGEIFHSELAQSELTPRQLAILITLAENEGLSQTGIAEKMDIGPSTVMDVVRRLRKKGWLQRRRLKSDARTYAVKLTEEGHELLRRAMPLGKKVDQRILEALPDRIGDQFIERLQAIVKTLQPPEAGLSGNKR
jgi:MarR family transcriptional regulator, temperature-dependent positive regulator of motility